MTPLPKRSATESFFAGIGASSNRFYEKLKPFDYFNSSWLRIILKPERATRHEQSLFVVSMAYNQDAMGKKLGPYPSTRYPFQQSGVASVLSQGSSFARPSLLSLQVLEAPWASS